MVSKVTFSDYQTYFPALESLLENRPLSIRHLQRPIAKRAGIYLFYKGETVLYVGQTRNLWRRLAEHTRKGSKENQASFAFQIACEDAGISMTQRRIESRKVLAASPGFSDYFVRAKERVAQMRIRFLVLDHEFADAQGLSTYEMTVLRTLFEVHLSLVHRTERYNSWDTH